MPRFIAEFDSIANEGRLYPRGSFDWPKDLFDKLRQTFQLSYSHDRTRVFLGTHPQVKAACRWLASEGLSVGPDAGPVSKGHPPVSCAACRDIAYRTRDLPSAGTPCQGCGEPLRFVCETHHSDGVACAWQAAS